MSDQKAAVLFPGQGAFSGAALKDVAAEYPQIAQTLAEIDAVAKPQLGVSLTETLLGEKAPNIEELMKGSPDVLQLAIYATSIGLHRILEAYGFRPTVVVGHSLGEISAMVCAGAFTVRDGAAIVCHRVQALKALGEGSGYMVALGIGATRTRRMLDLLEVKRAAIAVENEDRQTVVSGDEKELDAVTELAKVLNVPVVRIYSPYPFHSPVLEPIVPDFAARLREIEEGPLTVPVYSPILGRYYEESDRLIGPPGGAPHASGPVCGRDLDAPRRGLQPVRRVRSARHPERDRQADPRGAVARSHPVPRPGARRSGDACGGDRDAHRPRRRHAPDRARPRGPAARRHRRGHDGRLLRGARRPRAGVRPLRVREFPRRTRDPAAPAGRGRARSGSRGGGCGDQRRQRDQPRGPLRRARDAVRDGARVPGGGLHGGGRPRG